MSVRKRYRNNVNVWNPHSKDGRFAMEPGYRVNKAWGRGLTLAEIVLSFANTKMNIKSFKMCNIYMTYASSQLIKQKFCDVDVKNY